jgi:hypothetical protein
LITLIAMSSQAGRFLSRVASSAKNPRFRFRAAMGLAIGLAALGFAILPACIFVAPGPRDQRLTPDQPAIDRSQRPPADGGASLGQAPGEAPPTAPGGATRAMP